MAIFHFKLLALQVVLRGTAGVREFDQETFLLHEQDEAAVTREGQLLEEQGLWEIFACSGPAGCADCSAQLVGIVEPNQEILQDIPFLKKEWRDLHAYNVNPVGHPEHNPHGRYTILKMCPAAESEHMEYFFKGVAFCKYTIVKPKFTPGHLPEHVMTEHMHRLLGLSVGYVGFQKVAVATGKTEGQLEAHFLLTDYIRSVTVSELTGYDHVVNDVKGIRNPSVEAFLLGQLVYILKNFQDFTDGKVHGMVHRNINPDNILVPRKCLNFWEDEVVPVRELVDSGCALTIIDYRLACTEIPCRHHLGSDFRPTAGYAPPEVFEQGRHGSWSFKADVFAMGVVAYELLWHTQFPPSMMQDWEYTPLHDFAATYRRKLNWYVNGRSGQNPHLIPDSFTGARVSTKSIDLLRRMLQPDEGARPDANELWNDAFIQPFHEDIRRLSLNILRQRRERRPLVEAM